ncbi:DUF3616 domain-containing protein [Frankia sp. CNm7]|uniref:DUF3616 domain-containing protein n=1 Tax=Frankia nepalensis TaxID=1836974 RepID=A0A937RKD2_9ACTN|nr:DUF3616 domain-containing protein [Frankia nepalensis]MBL7498618.1 DUF3616 domain-containing protein [Frankia nepalensis]MBL7510488.1 DUF3616 domain-containing protein [Frankia nepalensis]MBL7517173.1 DUF3616 domain-containing protein [Frankia nepalensis]MBL7630505.1 DUF3616 domain-containing protein [Frankia nepalensis]
MTADEAVPGGTRHGGESAARTVSVRFGEPAAHGADEGDLGIVDIAESLSTLKAEGGCLWLGGDETVAIERVTLNGAGDAYGDHVSYPISDFLPLPEGPDKDGVVPEIDIEGLDRDGGYLWFLGSHSLTRKRVKPHHATEQALLRLAKVSKNRNRYLIGRIPVVMSAGLPVLVATASDPDRPGGKLTAAATGLRKQTRLTTALADDEHLGRFLKIPSKDNGLDIEGLAVVGEKIYVGLRGPVLRGWAIVLELRLAEGAGQDLVLAPVDPKASPDRYRKHFLDLDGLGVRDILAHGDDLLLLAGPTMDLDGPVRVYRWRGAAHATTSVVVTDEQIEHVVDIPYGDGDDHAEGITHAPGDESSLLVAYDSPAPRRRPHPHEILLDVLPLPTAL